MNTFVVYIYIAVGVILRMDDIHSLIRGFIIREDFYPTLIFFSYILLVVFIDSCHDINIKDTIFQNTSGFDSMPYLIGGKNMKSHQNVKIIIITKRPTSYIVYRQCGNRTKIYFGIS
jgi:hypothetical protein